MMKPASLLSLLLLAGCATEPPQPPTPPPPPPPPLSGPAVLDAIGVAMNAAGERIQPSLRFVEAQLRNGQTGQATGLLIDADGTILLPFLLDRDQVERIRVWWGGKEHPADFFKADERLRMTLVKASSSAGPFAPAPAEARPPVQRGEWLAGFTATGKDTDFQYFASLGLVGGRIPQEFDQILFHGGGGPPGTVLVDLSGSVVGLVTGGGRQGALVLAYEDVRRRLDTLLTPDAVAAASSESRDKGKPAIGIMFLPLNEEYAEACGLPKESVWVQQVFQGQPADRAGVKAGDLIIEVNGKPLGAPGERALQSLFKSLSPEAGREAALVLLRDGQRVTATCRFESIPDPKELKAEDLGLQVKEITDAVFYPTDNLFDRAGVLVTEVVRGGPASTSTSFRNSLVTAGDVILALDGQPTPSLESFASALDALRRRKDAPVVLLKIRRGVSLTYAALNLTLRQSRKGESR